MAVRHAMLVITRAVFDMVEIPGQEPLESDFDPWAGLDIDAWKAATSGSRARRPEPKKKAST